ncbi:MAG: hypothetical protein LBQ68_02420 [Clostridiales bacterium]|jgi:hypothetical protein|nr:hypothetical protein [Clostridiales bacterium]
MTEKKLLEEKLMLLEQWCSLARNISLDEQDSPARFIDYTRKSDKLMRELRALDKKLDSAQHTPENDSIKAMIASKAVETLSLGKHMNERATEILKDISLKLRRTKNGSRLSQGYHYDIFALVDSGHDIER